MEYCRWWKWLACLFLAVVLNSCYESPVPLSKPGTTLDHSLFGNWLCVPDPAQDPTDKAVVSILPFDEAQYYVEWNEDDRITRYRSYPTAIGDLIVLNVQEIPRSSQNEKWAFLRYHLTQTNELKFAIVNDESVKSKNEKGALEEIRKRASRDDLYSKPVTCVRQKQ